MAKNQVVTDSLGNRFITIGSVGYIVTHSGILEGYDVYYSYPRDAKEVIIFIPTLDSTQIFKFNIDQPWSLLKWSRIEDHTRKLIKDLKG